MIEWIILENFCEFHPITTEQKRYIKFVCTKLLRKKETWTFLFLLLLFLALETQHIWYRLNFSIIPIDLVVCCLRNIDISNAEENEQKKISPKTELNFLILLFAYISRITSACISFINFVSLLKLYMSHDLSFEHLRMNLQFAHISSQFTSLKEQKIWANRSKNFSVPSSHRLLLNRLYEIWLPCQ